MFCRKLKFSNFVSVIQVQYNAIRTYIHANNVCNISYLIFYGLSMLKYLFCKLHCSYKTDQERIWKCREEKTSSCFQFYCYSDLCVDISSCRLKTSVLTSSHMILCSYKLISGATESIYHCFLLRNGFFALVYGHYRTYLKALNKQEEPTFQETDLFHLKMLIVILIHVHIISVLRRLFSRM